MSELVTVAVLQRGSEQADGASLSAALLACGVLGNAGMDLEILAIGGIAPDAVGFGDVSNVAHIPADTEQLGVLISLALELSRGDRIVIVDSGELITADLLELSLAQIENDRVIAHAAITAELPAGGGRPLLRPLQLGEDPRSYAVALVRSSEWPVFMAGRTSELRQVRALLAAADSAATQLWAVGAAAAGLRHVAAKAVLARLATEDRVDGGDFLLPPFAATPLLVSHIAVAEPQVAQVSPLPRPLRFARRVAGVMRRRVQRVLVRVAPVRHRPPEGQPRAREVLLVRASFGALEPVLPGVSATLAHGVQFAETPAEGYAERLIDLLPQVPGPDGVLIVTPSVGLKTDDRLVLQYIRQVDGQRTGGGVAVLATGHPDLTRSWLIPPTVAHLQLASGADSLSDRERMRLVAQLMTLRGPIVVAVDSPEVTDAVGHWPALVESSRTMLVLSRPLRSSGPKVLPRDAGRLLLAAPTDAAAARLVHTVGIGREAVSVHHAPAADSLPAFDTVVQYTAAYDDVEFTEAYPFRVLVIVDEDSAVPTVERLEEIAENAKLLTLPLQIHLYIDGPVVPTGLREKLASQSSAPIQLTGRFERTLFAVWTQEYHCMLRLGAEYAAVDEQAALLGLPVLRTAPLDVDDVAAADHPVLAMVREMVASRDLRRDLVRAEYEQAAARHRPDLFSTAFRKDLTLLESL